ANLVLGRLNPNYFLGGRVRLDPARANEAIRTRLADPMQMTVLEAAAAVIEIVDAQMADLIRKVTVERGQDPMRFVIIGYGGAAGLHVGGYAATLGCRHVVIPSAAAVFSAYGIAASDAKRVAEVSDPTRAPFDLDRWRERFGGLEASMTRHMQEQRLPTEALVLRRFAHLQFRGQVHTVRVPVEDGDLAASDGGERVIERFVAMYEAKYGPGTAYRKAGVELVTFSVEAVARLPKPAVDPLPLGDPDARKAWKEDRRIYLHEAGAFSSVPVFGAERLRPGHRISGPALIEAEDMTILLHPGQEMCMDGLLNFRIELRKDGMRPPAGSAAEVS
ncbi:MAG: hydantoinase/oxoprolinase family protein, partial [bacterium]